MVVMVAAAVAAAAAELAAAELAAAAAELAAAELAAAALAAALAPLLGRNWRRCRLQRSVVWARRRALRGRIERRGSDRSCSCWPTG